jgi:hypothetical protein
MKNKKYFVLIITSIISFITIIISIFLMFYVFESGWPDRFYNEIKGIDWIKIIGLIIIILVMTIRIIGFLYNKKKAFKMIIKLYPHNYKMQSKIHILSLVFFVFSMILLFYFPSISSILLVSIVAAGCTFNILDLYFANGLYENGVMYSGMFYSWENIISHNYKRDNIIAFEIKNMFKELIELKFFFKSISCNEIDKIIRRSI